MSDTEQSGSFPAGTQLGAYVLDKCIGAGAMGEVYSAHHSGLGKRVAIKLLQRHVAENASIRARFLREGRTASILQHPHVVQVTDVGDEAGTPYLVMEYLEGESLAAMLRRERWQPVDRFVGLMLPIVDAVSVAHGNGVIHRDLKPENVFLTVTRSGEFHPKVLDFGISKILNDAADPMLTGTQAVLGTPHYMAPEQALQGRDVDARADQYSLGVMLYEGVTGKTPHHQTDSLARLVVAISMGQFDPPSTLRPDLHPDFEALIMRAMALQPADRFPSVAHLGAALLPFATARSRAHWEPVFLAAGHSSSGVASAPSPSTRNLPPASRPSGPEPTPRSSVPFRATTIGGGAAVPQTGPADGGTKRWTVSALILALAIAAVIGGVSFFRGSKTPATTAPSTYHVDVTAEPAHALVQIDAHSAGHGRAEAEFPRDGTLHTLLVSADGYAPRSVSFRDQAPPARIVLLPNPPTEAAAKAREVAKNEIPHEPPRAPHSGKKAARAPAVAPSAAEAPPAAEAAPAVNAGADDWSPRKRTDNKNPWGQ